jgi:hypothetical protein
MKQYYLLAVIIAALNIAAYPLTRHLAYLERGYQTYGGEDILLIAGFFVAFSVVCYGKEKLNKEKLNRSSAHHCHQTEESAVNKREQK